MNSHESTRMNTNYSNYKTSSPSSLIRVYSCLFVGTLLFTGAARAEVCNLRVVTDANPDYTDLPSLVRSATSRWETPEQKCWAMFYWNHVARRQTAPMIVHGLACSDPIRQFNDYGFTMCSTISGIEQSIWDEMGLKHKYWDISNHTVAEVFYDGRWHMYDNSLTALYTLCDGKTLASVQDIGKEGACEKSGGKVEPGHIAKYHAVFSTSPNGFLSGADTARSLTEEYRCFNPKGLKFRSYYYDWDHGHRYILNLKPGQSYTRAYHSLGDAPEFYVPNHGKDPESVNRRYHIRGNGTWRWAPPLTPAAFASAAHSFTNIAAADSAALHPAAAAQPAEIIYKVDSANVATAQQITAAFSRKSPDDQIKISLSTTNGLHWKELWRADSTGDLTAKLNLLEDVNGSYESLIRIELLAKSSPTDAVLKNLDITTTTELNSKTQPKLNIGKNTIYVGGGDQTESVVFWPDLQADHYKELLADEKNITAVEQAKGFLPAVHPATAKEDAHLVYRLDAPRDIIRLTYGGRFYNRAKGSSHIDLLHSFDEGKTWQQSWTLTSTAQPWDVIHYETIDVPAGHRSVFVKYLMNTPSPDPGCGLYAARMEADYLPADPKPTPLAVTFTWNEREKDYSLVQRSHTQLIDSLPTKYTIDVGGEDHPVMESLTISARGDGTSVPLHAGYSDGKDVGSEKYVGRWVTYGTNLAVGKPYTLSHPSADNWGAGDPDGHKLTDGVAGPPEAGGISYKYGVVWPPRTNPTITLDLGKVESCASFGLNFHGYPWHDALKGEIKDKIEIQISDDGQTYRPIGQVPTNLRWKDLPANYMWPDDEKMTAFTGRLVPEKPVTARFIKYVITSPRTFDVTELEVLDSIKSAPFDLRIALPDDKLAAAQP